MQDLMFADEPVEKREQLLRDNCDQIVERSYTRKFEQHEVNARREELGIEIPDPDKYWRTSDDTST